MSATRQRESATGSRRREPVRRFLASHLDSREVSRVVYGAIIGLAVLLAFEAHPPTPAPAAIAASLVATALAVALAELYSELVGLETRERRRVSGAERRHLRGETVAVAFGIAFPAVFFVLAAAGALAEDTAFAAAEWTGLGLIGAYGFAGARLAGARLPLALLQAAGVMLIGALLIGLKALVH